MAVALRNDPELVRHLAGITIMGGAAHTGNVTATAEFNIWADPEAAAIVFRDAAEVTMVGLEVTHKVLFGPPEIDRMRAAGTPAGTFAADLVAYAHEQCLRVGLPGGPIHDATAVIAVTHPHLFTMSRHPVTVELRGEHTRGMTVVDDRPSAGHGDSNGTDAATPTSSVVWDAQADRVIDLVIEAVLAA